MVVMVSTVPRGGPSGLVFRLAPVAMDVTLICTGPALGVGALDPICPSVAAGPGLALRLWPDQKLVRPVVWA